MSDNAGCGFFIMGFVISAIIFFFVGGICGIRAANKSAIEAGVAYWSVDEKTGDTTFEYKNNKQKEKDHE